MSHKSSFIFALEVQQHLFFVHIISVLSGDETVTKKDISFVRNVMAGMGMCHVMPEHLLDAAGRIVGCGPAYVSI